MSEDSGSGGRTQRTVAELLAQYGGPGVGTPRRRRRRADDDTGESAPQTIIDRVLSDSGRLRAIRDEEDTGVGGGRAPESEPARRQRPYQDPGTSSRARRSAMDQTPPPPSAPVRRVAPPPVAPTGRSGAPVPPAGKKPTPAAGPTASSSTLPPPDALADTTQVPPVRGGFPRKEQQPPTGNRLPRPDRRRRPGAPDQGTQMLRPEPEPRGGFDDQGTQVLRPEVEPPAGFGGFPDQGTQVLRPDQGGPLPKRGRPGAVPQAPQPPQAPVGGEGWTEQIPRIDVSALEGEDDDGPAAPQPPRPAAAGRFGEGPGPRVAADEPPAGLGGPPTEQWFDEELADSPPGYDDPEAEAFEDEESDAERFEDVEELEDDEDVDEEPKGSSAKEWLITLGQLGIGLVGGGGLWLAFQWLWQSLPAVAMVVALVVTVGLVLVVRLVRKAEDLQTTVLAILVGVVVTMSPAALLLVER